MEVLTFKIAKKLKKKGFKEKVNAYYGKHQNIFDVYPALDMNDSSYSVSAPTISQALKWLREEKKIYIEIFLYDRKYSCLVKDITQICEDDLFHKCLNEDADDEECATYEQAALAGIEYVLDNLI